MADRGDDVTDWRDMMNDGWSAFGMHGRWCYGTETHDRLPGRLALKIASTKQTSWLAFESVRRPMERQTGTGAAVHNLSPSSTTTTMMMMIIHLC